MLRPALALVLAAGAVALQGPLGDRTAERRRNDFRHTPDPKLVKVLAGAHRSSVADVLWLRALPDMSKEFTDTKAKARWIHGSIDAITELEPSFGTVYDFGQAYLTLLGRTSPEAIERAVKLLEKGARANPESAGIRVRLAMIHWLDRRDRPEALRWLRAAAALPDMDSLSNQMLATLEAQDRDDIVALGRWLPFIDKGTEEMRESALEKLYAIKTEIARRACRDYRTKHGRPATKPDDLRDPDLIQPGEATEIVLMDLVLRDGMPWYAMGEEMVLRGIVRTWGREARRWHDEHGAWPTIEELVKAEMRLPAAPPGKVWALRKDVLSLEDL